MFEIADPCFATSTSAARSPKSKSSHWIERTSTLPSPVTSLDTLPPRVGGDKGDAGTGRGGGVMRRADAEKSIWVFCQPCTMPADITGRKVLLAMPAASAALRASFQALRVTGLVDWAMSISSGRV